MVDDTRSGELTLPEDEPWMSHGFISKIAAQVSLPYRRPKDNAREIVRRNGNLVVRFISGEDCLPYGKYPRLFELWACTMIKTNNPCFDPETNVLHLGTTFREFLRMIDVQVGGRQLKSIKPQLERLFACSYHISNNTENETNMRNFVVAEKSRIDWLRNEPQSHGLFENWVQLSQGYVDMLRDHPVLTKRVYNLHEPVTIAWQQLYQQFGSDSELKEFKRKFKLAVAEVVEVYPCRLTLGPQRVTVFPNRTSVPTVTQTRAIERSREDDTKRSERERRNAERAEERRARAESRAEEQRQREEIQRRVSEERKRHGGSMFAGSAGYVEGEPDETGAEDDVWHDPDEMTLF